MIEKNTEKETEKNHEKLFLESGYKTAIDVEISIDKPTIWQKLTKKYIKNYRVKALVLNDILKISAILSEVPNLDDALIKELESPTEIYNFINKHGEKLVKIVAIFLNESEIFVKKNLTPSNMRDLFLKITELADVESFFYSMSLAKAKINVKKD